MKRQAGRRALRTKTMKFKPSRDYVNQAVENYLAGGGKITKLEFNEKSYNNFMQKPEAPSVVDDFLNGNY